MKGIKGLKHLETKFVPKLKADGTERKIYGTMHFYKVEFKDGTYKEMIFNSKDMWHMMLNKLEHSKMND